MIELVLGTCKLLPIRLYTIKRGYEIFSDYKAEGTSKARELLCFKKVSLDRFQFDSLVFFSYIIVCLEESVKNVRKLQ